MMKWGRRLLLAAPIRVSSVQLFVSPLFQQMLGPTDLNKPLLFREDELGITAARAAAELEASTAGANGAPAINGSAAVAFSEIDPIDSEPLAQKQSFINNNSNYQQDAVEVSLGDAPSGKQDAPVAARKSADKGAAAAQPEPRTIFINDDAANKQFRFRNNKIRTTRYTFLTFIPKNLFEQFSRVANVYFALISMLQLFSGLSPTGRFSTILPFSIVLIASACKDAFEDWKRKYSDYVVNNKTTHILRDGLFVKVKWADVTPGSIIRLDNKEFIPADVLALSSSEPGGQCYVETSSLDGETNLKIKRARNETNSLIRTEAQAAAFQGIVRCEQPNKSLYTFTGNLQIGQSQRISLDNDQVLLRGCSLRNTQWVIGTVLFTGHETKLMKNQRATPHKQSKVERQTNRLIFLLFGLLLFLAIVCTICVMFYSPLEGIHHWYLQGFYFSVRDARSTAQLLLEGIKSFITFVILFNNLVPISLYVSLELAKLLQGSFISKDLGMYHDETDTPANVQTSALNEELGQVEFIFSDKTGTLTQNKMEFLKCSVAGETYGTGITEIARAAAKREGKELPPDDRPEGFVPEPDFQFYDSRISNEAWRQLPSADAFLEFVTLLGVCHTVIPEGDPTRPAEIQFQASSPDEAALVKAAQKFGAQFHSRTPKDITVNIVGRDQRFDILNVCEFNSNRKRMSVICRNEQGKLLLYCKGADSVIYQRLRPGQEYSDLTLKHLEQFAREGLRTLVCAKVELDEAKYASWNKVFQEAECSVFDRARKLEEAAELIEKDLELVGVTAIEDKLQEGVPDTISELALGNIKIWVLTGDKLETAINIGFACDLLHSNMAMIILGQEGKSRSKLYGSLRKNLETLDRDHNASQQLAMVVEGDKLETILADTELKMLFLMLGVRCKAVICCRVSPSQKADVVALVKDHCGAITLAIGDGANDVAMIQAAHVGVGISGQEGLQAANAADYSFAQFRFLKRLLLVHGRWNYRRVAKLILYSFYKNTVLYLTQLWFVFFCAFSGQSVHDKWTISFYNVLFTALPIMALGVFDFDLKADVAEKYPELYGYQGHRNKFFNPRVFIQWMANSLVHSAICFFLPVLMFGSSVNPDGTAVDMLNLGITIYTSVLVTVTLRVMIETSAFTWINWLIIFLSVLSWPVFVLIYSVLYYIIPVPGIDIADILPFLAPAIEFIFSKLTFLSREVSNEFYPMLEQYKLFANPTFYLTVMLTSIVAISRDYVWKAWKRLVSRKLYYEVQAKAGFTDKEDIMKYFPMEEMEGKLPKRKVRGFGSRPLVDVKQLVSAAANATDLSEYRGFAFSEEERKDDKDVADAAIAVLQERSGMSSAAAVGANRIEDNAQPSPVQGGPGASSSRITSPLRLGRSKRPQRIKYTEFDDDHISDEQ